MGVFERQPQTGISSLKPEMGQKWVERFLVKLVVETNGIRVIKKILTDR